MASTLEDVGKQENPRLYFVTYANEDAKHEIADIFNVCLEVGTAHRCDVERTNNYD